MAVGFLATVRNAIARLTGTQRLSEFNFALDSLIYDRAPVSVQEALALPAIWRAVNMIASDVAKVPIDLYRRLDDGSRVAENWRPAAQRLRGDAAPGVSGFVFRKTVTAHALLTGNGFALIKRDGNRNPVQLIVLDPLRTRLDESRSDPRWKTVMDGVERSIPDADVLHISGLAWNGVEGESPLELLRDAIRLELAIQRFAYGFFRKGYALSGFLKSPRPLSPEEIARIRDEFRRRHSGVESAHDIAILAGGLDWQSAVTEPQKTQLVETRDAGLRAIANIFGVPPHKLGDPSRTSYASIEAENADYLQTSLDPWLVAWEVEATNKLISDNAKGLFYFEHNRNAIMRTQFSERVNGYAKLIEIGVLSPNEVREKENLNKRDGGDAYYVPANWMEQSRDSQRYATDAEAARAL